MASLIGALDQHTPKTIGENGHLEHGWSNNEGEKICQLYFQLVRSKNHSSIESNWTKIITSFIGKERENLRLFKMALKIIANVRDIKNGKGEYQLSYTLLYILHKYYPNIAKLTFLKFITMEDNNHCLGSFKDVKYFCNYIKSREYSEDHPFINYIVETIVYMLKEEEGLYNKGEKNSLLAKWLPREKSKKFGWLFDKIAYVYYDYIINTAKTSIKKRSAERKAKTLLRKLLAKINKKLDTTQIHMAGKTWSLIDFNKVTGPTLRIHRKGFQNITKTNTQRSSSEDRVVCALNLANFIEESKNGIKSVKGKRVDMYKLVKDAINAKTHLEVDLVNEQWKDNSSETKEMSHFVIPMSDVSGSMCDDEMIPLYNSIGFGIRMSEKTHPDFRNRILTFSEKPSWFKINENMSFYQKVNAMKSDNNWGQSTNFYKALELILNVCLENNIPPTDVEKMILAIFSDMQINKAQGGSLNLATMMENIKILFSEAGMKSIWKKPYPVPHILFWNLRKTDGFPNSVYEKNTTMISGYSPVLLNAFSEKGFDELKSITPFKMLEDILNHKNYNFIDTYCNNTFV